jgi:E3 ubiquitin-protein ligase BRE1
MCIYNYRIEIQHQLDEAKMKIKELSTNSNITSSTTNQGNKNTSSNEMNEDDASLLELTLSMLRCSVCKDRFKSACITRCLHLFCKECLDENLRNRHRKCPACGEKFGQDDVRTIFFTH